jgi:hypothetical protein
MAGKRDYRTQSNPEPEFMDLADVPGQWPVNGTTGQLTGTVALGEV